MHDYTKYFKDQSGFDRLINKLYLKYKSLAKFSGTIKLDNISELEAKTLSRFFGVNYKVGQDITISLNKFIKVMENSKYTDFSISILVSEYLGVSLMTNKEEKEMRSNSEDLYYQSIVDNFESNGSNWLKSILINHEMPYKLIHQKYNKNKESLKKELVNVIKLIDNLPPKKVLLPIYAANITNDPHYLDLDKSTSNLFFYALAYISKEEYPLTREAKIKLLAKNNVEIDNISNFAITYNLLADKDCINDFSKNQESLILNIQNIINTDYFDTKLKKVFIFENPSILTDLISKGLDVSAIISGGFPNTSVHLLLEKLISTNNKLYYNGDFDPEGMLIASRLKERYQDNLELFCYDEVDYMTSLSKKKINESRLKKLDKVNDIELQNIKELLLKNKYSAYQENNKDRIIEFIKDLK